MNKDEIVVHREVYDSLVEYKRDTKAHLHEFEFAMLDAPNAVKEWWDKLDDREFKFKFAYLERTDI